MKGLSEAGFGAIAFLGGLLAFAAAATLPRWKQNAYRFTLESIPLWVRVGGSIFLFLFLMAANVGLLGNRRGEHGLTAQFLPLIFTHAIALAVCVSLFAPFQRFDGRRAPRLVLAAIAAIYALLGFAFNSAIYADIAGMSGESLPTQRCYLGGSCHPVGYEVWGRWGTIFLAPLQLLQGGLLLAALWGTLLALRPRP